MVFFILDVIKLILSSILLVLGIKMIVMAYQMKKRGEK